MIQQPKAQREGVFIVGLFAVLAATYSLVTPIFEASDEISHYPVVHHIATTGQLPIQRPGVDTLWEQEGSQPPLYYLIGAALTFWIDTSDLPQVRWRNPHAKLGIPLDPDNKNMVIHTEAERFPWRGTVLAVHLLRFLGVALSAATVALTYRLTHEVWPDKPHLPLLAAALVAFNPMFLFISGSVNNDNLIILLSTWGILLCARIVIRGLPPRRAVTLAVVAALATLTKISGLTLLPLIGLTLAIHAIRRQEWRSATAAGLGLVAAWLILAGWWYVRNLVLYGELLGLNTHVAIAGTRSIRLLDLIAREWYGFWVSYWALFGAVNILADPAVYTFYASLQILALGGVLGWAVERLRARDLESLLLPSLFAFQTGMVLAGVIRWTLTTYASQGRLMFPVISALSVLTALGLVRLVPEQWRRYLVAAVGLPLLAVAVLAPFHYIAPVYAPPHFVTTIPVDTTPIGAFYDGLELVAVKSESVTVEEGGRIPITLYWRATQPLDQNFSLYLHALGRNAQEIGKIDSYPGAGSLPTTRMQPGVIIEDPYSLELDADFEAPTALRVLIGVGVWDQGTYTVIEPRRGSGEPMGSAIVEAGVAYPYGLEGCNALVSDAMPLRATFGGFARMWASPPDGSYQPGDVIPVELIWDRVAATAINWTVFVHLLGPDNMIVAQADGPPLNNDYPTSLWRRSCQILDVHNLTLPATLPAGDYLLIVGLYDASDPAYTRALAVAPDGAPYPGQAVPLGTIGVEAP